MVAINAAHGAVAQKEAAARGADRMSGGSTCKPDKAKQTAFCVFCSKSKDAEGSKDIVLPVRVSLPDTLPRSH